MFKTFLLTLLVVSFASWVAGQDKRVEVFGGFSYSTIDDHRSSQPIDHVGSLDGFNIAATGFVTKRFGITGDFSAGFHSGTEPVDIGTLRFSSKTFTYLAGPHYRFMTSSRWTPFVHALAGVANARFSYRLTPNGSTSPNPKVSQSATDFSLALGGGLDLRANKHISVRLFQIDYAPVFAKDRPQFGAFGARFDNVRFSIGVVFR